MAVAGPALLIVATAALSEDQAVLSGDGLSVWPSKYVTTKLNCWVALIAIVGFAGVTLTDVMSRSFTKEETQLDSPRIESMGRNCTSRLNLINRTPCSLDEQPKSDFSNRFDRELNDFFLFQLLNDQFGNSIDGLQR